ESPAALVSSLSLAIVNQRKQGAVFTGRMDGGPLRSPRALQEGGCSCLLAPHNARLLAAQREQSRENRVTGQTSQLSCRLPLKFSAFFLFFYCFQISQP
uniref:Uncharacterized protein n=1 Tax=Oncorhynchus kisutch TaxID=8019 RepID=A0A8C7GB49_ONCKI